MGHTIESIREALRNRPSAEEAFEIMRACPGLRSVRQARINDLTPLPGLSFEQQPKAYRDALVEDPLNLEVERDRLAAEIRQIEALEGMAYRAHEAALDAKAKAEIPKAMKRLPKTVKALEEALAAVECAAATFNEDFNVLARYAELMGKPYKPSDGELSRMLAVREKLWQPLEFNVPFTNVVGWDPQSDAAKAYPKSWPYLFEQRGPAGSGTIVSRRAPQKPLYLPDYSDPVAPMPGDRRMFDDPEYPRTRSSQSRPRR